MKRLVVGGAVLALGIGGMAISQAAPAQYKVTGGGQIIADSSANGPGQTLAFTAQSTGGPDSAASGQLQYNAHDGSTQFHGTITCLLVNANTAEMAGVYDNGSGKFKLTVTDNGQGAAADDDAVVFDPKAGDTDCSNGQSGDSQALGRGNIVIHKENTAK